MVIEICVQKGALSPHDLRCREAGVSAGAVVTFCGVVRNLNMGYEVVALDYDCAPQLAESCLRQIAEETLRQWEAEQIIIHHGYGYIGVGETSVFILVATPKRDAAFEACRHIIEEIKKRVPIWKLEVYADGQRKWLEGTALPEAMGHRA